MEKEKRGHGTSGPPIKHGHARRGRISPEYNALRDMHKRCYNPKSRGFKNWGGRGIQVCLRWHRCNPDRLQNFIADMGLRPSPQHTIHRINNDWSYMPSNCKWATWLEQARNRRPPVERCGGRYVHRLPGGKFRARIRWYGKQFHVGSYPSFDEAATKASLVRQLLAVERN